MLIANLPYITDDLDRRALAGDPPRAAGRRHRRCGEDGLGIIRGLIAETPSGWRMALEHDTHHGPAMRELLREAETRTDYRGDERVTVGLAP